MVARIRLAAGVLGTAGTLVLAGSHLAVAQTPKSHQNWL
jgi:hypothetical protein